MTTQDALLAAILANPADDLCRLVYADWLDENGQVERAEFIRRGVSQPDGGEFQFAVNPHLTDSFKRAAGGIDQFADGTMITVRRGFISAVRCTLADWCGGECSTCNPYALTYEPYDDSGRCSRCGYDGDDGPGRIPGIGPAVVRSQPVERVTLTDRVPYETGIAAFPYAAFITADVGRPDFLPLSLLTDNEQKAMAAGAFRQHVVYATTVEEFTSEVSKRLIAWAKAQPHHARITSHPVAVDLES